MDNFWSKASIGWKITRGYGACSPWPRLRLSSSIEVSFLQIWGWCLSWRPFFRSVQRVSALRMEMGEMPGLNRHSCQKSVVSSFSLQILWKKTHTPLKINMASRKTKALWYLFGGTLIPKLRLSRFEEISDDIMSVQMQLDKSQLLKDNHPFFISEVLKTWRSSFSKSYSQVQIESPTSQSMEHRNWLRCGHGSTSPWRNISPSSGYIETCWDIQE